MTTTSHAPMFTETAQAVVGACWSKLVVDGRRQANGTSLAERCAR
jgi:hypothetical protein